MLPTMRYWADLFYKIIKIKSVSLEGNEELVSLLADLLQERGFKTNLQQVSHSEEGLSRKQWNLIGILGDPLVDRKIRKGLLLHAPLDTTSPGLLEAWGETAGDPWTLAWKERKAYGLGAVQGKLDFLAKIKAVEKLRERKLKQPVYLVGTCARHCGMQGVRYLLQSRALNPRYVLVGEPTCLHLVYAHKSCEVFQMNLQYQQIEKDSRGFHHRVDLQFFGKRAPGWAPQMGQNALVILLHFLKGAQIERGLRIQLASLSAGDGIKQVPDLAQAQLYLPDEDLTSFQEYASAQMGVLGSFECHYGGVGAMGIRVLPPAVLPCLLDLLQLFDEVGLFFQEKNLPQEGYIPLSSTLNWQRIHQKSGTLEILWEMHSLPSRAQGTDSQEPEGLALLQEKVKTMASRYPEFNLLFKQIQAVPAFQCSLEEEWVRLTREVLIASQMVPQFSKVSASTEAAWYSQAGFPTLVFGPGAMLGKDQELLTEQLAIEQWEKAVLFYQNLIERICL